MGHLLSLYFAVVVVDGGGGGGDGGGLDVHQVEDDREQHG